MLIMKNPPHPGEILREEFLRPLNITITEAAKKLGVTRKTLSDLVNEKRGVSSEMALRLAKAFGTSIELWVNMQAHYEIAKAQSEIDISGVEVIYKAS